MKKIKILRIITRLCVGGPTIHVSILSNAFTNEKYDTILVAGKVEKYETDMSYVATDYDVKPVYIDSIGREVSLYKDIKSFIKLYRLIRDYKPDIVHAHLSKVGVLGRLAALFSRVPIILFTYHGNMYTRSYPFLKKLPVILTERLINTCSTMTIAISDAQKKTLMDYKVAKSEKVAVIHLGFDFSKILPVSDWKDSLKIKYGLPANSLIVSIIGRVTPVKNHPFFIKIAERLIPLHENLFFLVIGDGDDFDSVYQIVKEKRLDERIHFTGMIRDMREAYTITDALVLTSDSEGTPVVLIEAMASRKVVFSTNVGGVSDFIVNGRNGFYYEQGDINGFVTEISNWVSNPQDYIPIQEEAHRTAMAKFSSERLISDVDQLYQKLLIDKGLL